MHRFKDWDLSEIDPTGPKLNGPQFFLLTMSLLSLANLVLLVFLWNHEGRYVIFIVEAIIASFFTVSFGYRVWRSGDKRFYFLHQGGWVDLIAAIPLPGCRMLKVPWILRELRLIRHTGLVSMLKNGGTELATASLIVSILFTFCVVEFGSIWIIRPESADPNANIQSASDAIWWSYVTITTVGYGDEYPVTPRGRIVGVLTLTLGVILFAVITGFIANSFTNPKAYRRAAEERDRRRREEIHELKVSIDTLHVEIRQLRNQLTGLVNDRADKPSDP